MCDTSSLGDRLPDCPNKPRLLLANPKTFEAYRPRCKSYKCEYCGPRKAYALSQGLISEFKGAKIRLLTLTCTNRFDTPRFELAQAAWREFNKMRTVTPLLTAYQRRFRYARLVERHVSGHRHYHLLVDRYLPVYDVQTRSVGPFQTLWQSACEKALAKAGIAWDGEKLGNANIEGRDTGIPHKLAVKYVVKYVTKEAKDIHQDRFDASGGDDDFACDSSQTSLGTKPQGKKFRRKRPYTVSRGIHVWASKQETKANNGKWMAVKGDVWLGDRLLYLSQICLLPAVVEGEITQILPDEWVYALFDEDGTLFPVEKWQTEV